MYPTRSLLRFDRPGRYFTLRLALAVATAIASSSSFAATASAAQTVNISKSAFEPKELTVAPGTTVVWVNLDDMPHTVMSRDRSFASKGLDTNDKFEYTFQRDGDFEYYCTVHPFMTGVIHVRR